MAVRDAGLEVGSGSGEIESGLGLWVRGAFGVMAVKVPEAHSELGFGFWFGFGFGLGLGLGLPGVHESRA